MNDAENRRKQAEQCLRYAEWVTKNEHKDFWLRCAEDWQKLAEKAEMAEGGRR